MDGQESRQVVARFSLILCCIGTLFRVEWTVEGIIPSRESAQGVKENILAKDNYSYKKRQKELAKKKEREEKLQNKLNKRNAQTKTEPEQQTPDSNLQQPS